MAVAAVGFGLGVSGLPFYTASVFLDPLIGAFHWTAAQAQSGLLVMLWALAVLWPAAGWAAEKFGVRRVALVSVALFGPAFMALGLNNGNLLLYRLNFGLIGFFGAGTLPVIWSRAVNSRFVRSRGLALGIVLAGSGVTAFLAPLIANWLIHAVGWRMAYVWLGAAPLLVSLPLVTLGFREARALEPESHSASEVPGATFGEAMASWRFWLIAISIAAVAAAVAGCIPNLVKILVANGENRDLAIRITSLIGVFVVAGRALSGYLIDKFWAPGIAAVFIVMPVFGCFLLVHGDLGVGGSIVAAALIGLAAGAEFDLLAYLVAAYFGLKRFAAIYGVAGAIFALAAGAAPFAFGAVFDKTGSYSSALIIAGAVFVVSGLSLLLLGPYALSAGERSAGAKGAAS